MKHEAIPLEPPEEETELGNASDLLEKIQIGLGEYFGTLILVFLSCMPCTLQLEVSSLHGSFASGLAVMTAIHIFGHVSGAYVNPAVTLAAYIMGQTDLIKTGIYVASQIAGAVTGYALLEIVTPDGYIQTTHVASHCATVPHEHLSDFQAVAVEAFLTLVLQLAICATWDKKNHNNLDSVALRIGFIVVLLNLAAGPYTGASMNPARSFGPILWNNFYYRQWVYWVGPMIGATTAAVFYKKVFLREK